ncbi:unnamed protein product [Prorocentrum cordatum]|uniref:Reverse transcriptase RNase H-like domain-containing protein n=1 Tax=Prorocentrum cordatum TaxID=2364126 RepID=A0ABN9YJI7_9DINO|nr:unnamed protein product [Polarella glacialis]
MENAYEHDDPDGEMQLPEVATDTVALAETESQPQVFDGTGIQGMLHGTTLRDDSNFGQRPLGADRTIKRAEMWAFYQALRHATPPFTVHTDHKGIVDGIGRGKAWCVSAKRPHADDTNVRHVKAYSTQPAMQALDEEDRRVAKGNEVDLLAKDGAAVDAGFGKVQALEDPGHKTR